MVPKIVRACRWFFSRKTGKRSPYRKTRPLWLEVLEDRTAPAIVTWVNPIGGDWDTGGNWSTNGVPGLHDDAVINIPGITVTHKSNSADSVNSLSSQDAVSIANGSLSLATSSTINNALTVSNGASLFASQLAAVSLALQGGILQAQGHELDLTVSGQISVDASSRIDVSGQGYGMGQTNGGSIVGDTTTNIGGSYGGLGGVANGQTNAVYGDYTNPTDWGSGGYYNGVYPVNMGSESGGGLVRLTAGTLALDGQIVADGMAKVFLPPFPGSFTAGAGSGGGIYVSVTTLQGTGSIHAAGASATDEGGGGGRVALYATDWSGFKLDNIQAPGGVGNNGAPSGGAGTVYLKQTGAAYGTLIVDAARGGTGATPLGLPGESSHTFTDAVVISGTGTSAIAAAPAQTLDFQQGLTIENSASLQVSSGLTVAGALSWAGGNISGPVIANGSVNVKSGTVNALNGSLAIDNSAALSFPPLASLSITGNLLGTTTSADAFSPREP